MTKICDTLATTNNVRKQVNTNIANDNSEPIFKNNTENVEQSTNEKILEIEQKLSECRDKYKNASKNGTLTGGIIGLFTAIGILGSNALEDSEIERIGQNIIDKIRLPRNKNLAAIGIITLIAGSIIGGCTLAFRVFNKLHCKTMVERYEQDLELEKAKLNTLN